jgi:RimJ/RimL family protein N-acetyltransferase
MGSVAASSTRENGSVSGRAEWQSTARLSLRPPTPADAPAVFRILSNRAVVEHNPSELIEDVSDIEKLLERWLEHWSEHGFGNCCVFEKESGQLIGNCGIRWTTVQTTPVLNLLYRFDPGTWGRGYATEAARAVVDWAFENLPGQVVLARVRPGNLASQGVATNIGLRRDPIYDDQGQDGLDWAFTSRLHDG